MSTPPTHEELHAQVQAPTGQVEELTQRLDQGSPARASGTAGGTDATLRFATVEARVPGLFLLFGWPVDGQRWFWCPRRWWHAEAIWRLELLWRSWGSGADLATDRWGRLRVRQLAGGTPAGSRVVA